MTTYRALNRSLAIVLMLALGGAGAATAQPGLVPHAPQAPEAPDAPLEAFLDQFASIDSVLLEAEVVIHVETPQGTRTGHGTFTYAEQGDRFHIRCTTDRHLGLMADVEWAYDGETSLLWLLADNTVSANTSLDREAPTALPNPFFLPVDFLLDQECATCRASIAKVVDARQQVTTNTVIEDGEVQVLTGRSGLVPSHRVEVAPHGELWVPSTITRQLQDRPGRVTLNLANYEPSGKTVFPRSMSVIAEDEATGSVLRMEILVTRASFDELVLASAFRIEGNEETTFIFSGDEEKDIPVPQQ